MFWWICRTSHQAVVSMASSLLHFTKNFPQAFRYVVRILWCPIIPLQVLQEADEQGVHGHGVDGEEAAGKY